MPTYNPRSQQSINQARNISQEVTTPITPQNTNLWGQVVENLVQALRATVDSRETLTPSPSETNIPWNYIATSLVDDLQKIVGSFLKRQEFNERQMAHFELLMAPVAKLNSLEFHEKIYAKIAELEKETARRRNPGNPDPDTNRDLSNDYWDNCIVRSVKNFYS